MIKNLEIHKKETTSQLEVYKQFFDEEGEHLNDSGITLYVEGLILKRQKELPKEIINHVEECPQCQHEVFDFYEMMKDEPIDNLGKHPFFDDKTRKVKDNVYQMTSRLGKAAAIVVFIVFSGLAYLISTNNTKLEEQAVKSPFKNQNIQKSFEKWQIDVSEAKTVYLPSGSKINIPAYSFVDEIGNPIRGKVDVSYRELQNTSDLIASGYPMILNNQALESGGTFEIRGKQNGKPVYIAHDKKIEINLASKHGGKNLHNYFLEIPKVEAVAQSSILASVALADNPEPKWEDIGKSALSKRAYKGFTLRKLKEQYDKEIDSLAKLIDKTEEEWTREITEQEISFKEPNNHQSNINFSLNLNIEEYYELIRYKDKVWQYAGEDLAQSPTHGKSLLLSYKWDELNLTSLKYKPLSLKGHEGAVNQAVFSPNNQLIATASDDRTIKIWSNKAQYLRTLNGHKGAVNTVVFSPNGQTLLSASKDHKAKLWTVQGQVIATLSGHQAEVLSAEFSKNGKYILTRSKDNTARLWNSRGQFIQKISCKNGQAFFSNNTQYISTLTTNSSIEIYRIKSGNCEKIQSIKGVFNFIQFSPDNHYVLAIAHKQATYKTKLFNLEGRLVQEMSINDEKVYFTKNGKGLVSINKEDAKLWHINMNASKVSTPHLMKNMSENWKKHTPTRGHQGTIEGIYFAPNGQIITSGKDNTAIVWDNNGKARHFLREHGGKVNSVMMSSNHKQLLTASDDNLARLWVERQSQDVFEMELIKREREIRKKGSRRYITLPRKTFYTTVKMLDDKKAEELTDVVEVSPDENPVNRLIKKHAKLIAERKALNEQNKLPKESYLRYFEVKQFGVYSCGKPFNSALGKTIKVKIDLPQHLQGKSFKVYQSIGQNISIVKEYNYQKGKQILIKYYPDVENRLLMILPKDDIAVIPLRNIDYKKVNHLKVNQIKPIKTRIEWERVFD